MGEGWTDILREELRRQLALGGINWICDHCRSVITAEELFEKYLVQGRSDPGQGCPRTCRLAHDHRHVFCYTNRYSPSGLNEAAEVLDSGVCIFCSVIEFAKSWLDQRVQCHTKCRKDEAPKLPTRVLDVGPRQLSNNADTSEPFLYESPKVFFHHSEYVALSYCWGVSGALTTTTSTLEERKRGIPMHTLPTTIRDAVYITRKLGKKYLWVDSLCIRQDSVGDADSECVKEVANMDQVYGNAYITLVAAGSDHCNGGILGNRIAMLYYWNGTFFPAMPCPGYRREKQEEPIYRRGWTLQERLLSCRILSFGRDEIWGECKGEREVVTEFGLGDSKFKLITDWYADIFAPSNSLNSIRDWYAIVKDYTSRYLTREEDKLPALSGIAKAFQISTKGTYLAGVWKQDLQQGLLWVTDYETRSILVQRVRPSRPATYRAPSWSWASIDGNVRFATLVEGKEFPAQVIDYRVILSGKHNPFGAI
ncbi:HET-domain-containing protein [Acephala macrosclerotiorum]|nr:HET-domain-containing protein [Acephala macrosclerotiorum]